MKLSLRKRTLSAGGTALSGGPPPDRAANSPAPWTRRLSAALQALWRSTAASVWGPPALRSLAVLAGLIALAIIGHSALAEGPSARAPEAASKGRGEAPAAPQPEHAATSEPTAAVPPPATSASASAGRSSPPSRASPEDPVALNEATPGDLQRLPGVGPKRADAIVALRARLGRFRQIEDLLRVRGIGRATLKRLRPLLQVNRAAARPVGEGGADGEAGTR